MALGCSLPEHFLVPRGSQVSCPREPQSKYFRFLPLLCWLFAIILVSPYTITVFSYPNRVSLPLSYPLCHPMVFVLILSIVQEYLNLSLCAGDSSW